jgi:hypothetical protein
MRGLLRIESIKKLIVIGIRYEDFHNLQGLWIYLLNRKELLVMSERNPPSAVRSLNSGRMPDASAGTCLWEVISRLGWSTWYCLKAYRPPIRSSLSS